MKCLLVIAFVFVIRTAVTNQVPPDPCCTAEQFEISYGGIIGQTVNDNRNERLQQYFKGAFDFKNQQHGMDVYIMNYTDGSEMRFKVYILLKKSIEYIVMDSKCYQVPVQSPPSRCVPESAVYVTSFSLGNQALFLNDWRSDGSAAGFVGEVYATTASKDCTPGPTSAVGTVESEGEKVSFISQGTYMNFTGSITDPDYWFVPPASCANATQLVSDSRFQPLRMLRRLQATNLLL